MKIIGISDPVYCEAEAEIINDLFYSGLEIMHLRKQVSDQTAYQKLIETIDKKYRNRIVLNNYHDLGQVYGISRLHCPSAERHKMTGQGFIWSTSIHDLIELDQVHGFNYVFYGPVYNSISKKDYNSVLTPGFKLPKEINQPKIIALGGVEPGKLKQLQNIGFDGVGLLGTLWQDPKLAVRNFRRIKNEIE